ncbi:MAG: hypothetical protein ABIM89_00565, partial [Mycobacteriales bacterium]
RGFPPSLSVCNTDSLGEQIQRACPRVRVVKTLNTVTAALMTNPAAVAGGDHTLFMAGNDAEAKVSVKRWLNEWFGWRDVIDVGDITAARGMEMYLPLCLRLYGAEAHPCSTSRCGRPTDALGATGHACGTTDVKKSCFPEYSLTATSASG